MSTDQSPSDDGAIVITRDIDLPVSVDELWSWMADGERWAEWLTDQADVVVEPHRVGTVVDDGIERRVSVQTVEPGQRVTFRWWPTDRPHDSSLVELIATPMPGSDPDRSRLSIVETHPTANSTARASAADQGSAAHAWEVRVALLVFCVQAVSLIRA